MRFLIITVVVRLATSRLLLTIFPYLILDSGDWLLFTAGLFPMSHKCRSDVVIILVDIQCMLYVINQKRSIVTK